MHRRYKLALIALVVVCTDVGVMLGLLRLAEIWAMLLGVAVAGLGAMSGHVPETLDRTLRPSELTWDEFAMSSRQDPEI